MAAPTVSDSIWRSFPAWLIQGAAGGLQCVVMKTGAHLAALYAADDAEKTNPLWQPIWPTGTPAAAAAADTWGEGPESFLLTGIVGSNLCLDRFGASHPGEAERPLHGEAGVVAWAPVAAASPGAASFSADLPLAGLRVVRSFAPSGPRTLVLTTRVERVAGADAAPVEWCEHTTLGPPFLDGVSVAAGVDAAAAMVDPAGPGGADAEPAAVDVAAALAVPAADAPPAGSVVTARVDAPWWTATNAALGWRLSAAWDRDAFPWLCLWTESRLRTHRPWGGASRSRGMELSTKPFPEGAAPAARRDEYLGRPAVFRVAAGAPAEKTITFTWERV